MKLHRFHQVILLMLVLNAASRLASPATGPTFHCAVLDRQPGRVTGKKWDMSWHRKRRVSLEMSPQVMGNASPNCSFQSDHDRD